MISEELQNLKYFFKLFLPKNRNEWIIYLSLMIFYFAYALYFIFNTSIIDHTVVEADLYFSYDNPLILKNGKTQINGHPLVYIFYYPFVLLGNLLASLLGFKARTLLFVFLSTTMVSMACVYVNRYLREIVELKDAMALSITLFFAFFSTNLILSFTPETFTLAQFFLCFNIYYYSTYIKNGGAPSFLVSALLSTFMLGAVTITNFIKGILPNLFLDKPVVWKVKRIVGLLLVFVLTILLIHAACMFFMHKDYLAAVMEHKSNFTSHFNPQNPAEYFRQITDHFFGAPIFFPELQNFFFYNVQGHWGYYDIKMVMEIDYKYWWQFAFIIVLAAMILLSFIKNYRNKFVQLIFLLFAVDVGIHCVFGFGLGMPFIYGGHWVYCIPLVIGWLAKGLQGTQLKVFIGVFAVLFVSMLANNIVRMFDFARLTLELYPLQ